MRQLRFVRAAADGEHVVLESADGGEQFLLHVDGTLRDAVRADLPRLAPAAVEPEPRITPREIQVRVRAGERPRDIAETFEARLDWVMRFAAPVLDERARMADEARRARARRTGPEGQTVVFGEAVDERFAAHGIDPAAVRWDARRREDGQWTVAATWLGGADEHTAEWTFQLSGRSVAPIDDTAADLLSDRPVVPIMPPAPRREAVSLAAAPPLAPGVVAFPAMPGPHAGPLPAAAARIAAAEIAEDVFDQDRVAAPPAEPFGTPPLPLHAADPEDEALFAAAFAGSEQVQGSTARLPRVTNLGVAGRGETDEAKAARARIPSWDDILLGVRRKSD